MNNSSTEPLSKSSKNVSKSTAKSHSFTVKTQTVEVVVFSPEIIKRSPRESTGKGWIFEKPVLDYVEEGWDYAVNSTKDYVREKTLNPGHIALRIDDILYNFGRYGEHGYISGDAILREDPAQKKITDEIPKRHWIFGFVIVVQDKKAIQDKIKALKATGTQTKSGLKVGDYQLTSNSCKTFTLDHLQAGGVTLPEDFGFFDYPVDVRDDFLLWREKDPKRVIQVINYKQDAKEAESRAKLKASAKQAALANKANCSASTARVVHDFGLDDLDGKQANSQVDHMEAHWDKVSKVDAQRLANQGELVVAGRKDSSHGHVAIVVPGEMVWSGKRKDHYPLVAGGALDSDHPGQPGNAYSAEGHGANFAWGGDKSDEVTYYRPKKTH